MSNPLPPNTNYTAGGVTFITQKPAGIAARAQDYAIQKAVSQIEAKKRLTTSSPPKTTTPSKTTISLTPGTDLLKSVVSAPVIPTIPPTVPVIPTTTSKVSVTTSRDVTVPTNSNAPTTQVGKENQLSGGVRMANDDVYTKIDSLLGGILPNGAPVSAGTEKFLNSALNGIPGGKLGLDAYLGLTNKKGSSSIGGRRYRRQDYGNIKALKRADRRIGGFIKTYRKVASSVGYTVKRKEYGGGHSGTKKR